MDRLCWAAFGITTINTGVEGVLKQERNERLLSVTCDPGICHRNEMLLRTAYDGTVTMLRVQFGLLGKSPSFLLYLAKNRLMWSSCLHNISECVNQSSWNLGPSQRCTSSFQYVHLHLHPSCRYKATALLDVSLLSELVNGSVTNSCKVRGTVGRDIFCAMRVEWKKNRRLVPVRNSCLMIPSQWNVKQARTDHCGWQHSINFEGRSRGHVSVPELHWRDKEKPS
jgi:hypothetical protein